MSGHGGNRWAVRGNGAAINFWAECRQPNRMCDEWKSSNGAVFFPDRPFDPPRAGMIASNGFLLTPVSKGQFAGAIALISCPTV
jgi:hypothetical protein